MGITSSSLESLKSNPCLLKYVSKNHIEAKDDKFWNELLSISLSTSLKNSDHYKQVEKAVSLLLDQFLTNNNTSKNLSSLIRVFSARVSQLKSFASQEASGYKVVTPNLVFVQALNAVIILRLCLKQLVQTLSEENVVHQFSTVPIKDISPPSPTATIELLIESLTGVVVHIPVSNQTYALHAESITALLVVLSVQMYSIKPASKSSIYKILMSKKCSSQAQVLMRNLLNNFLEQAPAPTDNAGSLIVGLASGLMNVLSLGYTKPEEDPDQTAVLAKLSVWLILILTNHFTCENPYRDAIVTCTDCKSQVVAGDTMAPGFKIDFNRIFVTISMIPNDDQISLLLYILIHRNAHFRTYVLSRTSDLDQIVIPILKIMYDCPERSSHHVYMALILLLILTEDTLFNESIHVTMVKNVVWYKEKVLTEISLGGLMVLVVIRALQFNISRTRDKFLHTNLLATLANMSSHFKYLNPYVCQKILTLFVRISKRFHRKQSISSSIDGNSNNAVAVDINGTNGQESEDHETGISASHSPDSSRDLAIYEEVLRMILEIINSCLSSQLTHNPNLIYTLLYNRQVFEPYQEHPSFKDIVMNIETVIAYFTDRIATESSENTLSVSEIYLIIENSSKKWPSEKLKVFAPLKFKYVEDDQPEEFFIPYIWSLVYNSSFINFNSQNILLFNPNKSVT